MHSTFCVELNENSTLQIKFNRRDDLCHVCSYGIETEPNPFHLKSQLGILITIIKKV